MMNRAFPVGVFPGGVCLYLFQLPQLAGAGQLASNSTSLQQLEDMVSVARVVLYCFGSCCAVLYVYVCVCRLFFRSTAVSVFFLTVASIFCRALPV